MVLRKPEGALTADEKRIVKALLAKGFRNQDIQALVNIGREATINSARITEVKSNKYIIPAQDDEIEFYQIRKKSYDPKTGLNLFDDERLIRAREAIILAVEIFNSPSLKFKTEVFTMLANVAWTYLLHEFYSRSGVEIIGGDGRSLLLSQMIERHDCPITPGVKNNLRALKILRDEVEHKLLGKGDLKWLSLFQACCLNFNKSMCELFGENLTLAHDLSFALQFARMNFDQVVSLNKFELPEFIDAIDARIEEGISDSDRLNLEFRFRVIYTLDSSSKSRSHIEFIRPDSAEGKDIRNVLVQHKLADELYPHKPSAICAYVREKTGKSFSIHNHTQAWRIFNVRPPLGAAQPSNTKREFCIYHAAHKDYTFSDKWANFLVEIVNDAPRFEKLKEVKL